MGGGAVLLGKCQCGKGWESGVASYLLSRNGGLVCWVTELDGCVTILLLTLRKEEV